MMDIIVNLGRTNVLLERIAIALERAVGPDPLSYTPRQRQASELIQYGKQTWLKEQLMEELTPMGLSPKTEKEILDAALDEILNEED